MQNDYIVLDIGKIVIIRNGTQSTYYKEIDNKLYELTKEELEIVNNTINIKYTEVCKSERLTNLIKSNNNIPEDSYYINLIESLESILPENFRGNLYKNVSTLKIETVDEYEYENNIVTAVYNFRKNTISINKKGIEVIKKIAKNTPDPTKYMLNELDRCIFHELVHMASTNYDKETSTSLSGFHKYPTDEPDELNMGITEGITYIIESYRFPSLISDSLSGYLIEGLLVNQLLEIIDKYVVFDSYFNNKGTKKMQSELNKLINNPTQAQELFIKLENNFRIKNLDFEQNITANIQNTLIDYYIEKIKNDYLEDRMTFEQIEQSILIYEQCLITPEKLKTTGKNPDKYAGLNETIQKFNKFKRTIIPEQLEDENINNKSIMN